MKYIRTKDGHIFEIEKDLGRYGISKAIIICDFDGKFIDVEKQNMILKQADTIDELIDICVIPEYIEPLYPLDVAIEHYQYCGKDVYGAIWVEGEHGEPILKSVAKIKGFLSNDKIDWDLL